MKIKAGSNVDIGGSVSSGKAESPFWTHFDTFSWLLITALLIVATVILYALTEKIEIADIFTGLIGVSIGALSRRILPARGVD